MIDETEVGYRWYLGYNSKKVQLILSKSMNSDWDLK